MIKVIVSSASLLAYLERILEFLKGSAKIKIVDDQMQIDGFTGFYCEAKSEGEVRISVSQLQKLARVLRQLTDQPLTIKFEEGINWITIEHLIL